MAKNAQETSSPATTPDLEKGPAQRQEEVDIDDVLTKIGTHRAQYLILLITTICAGFFAMQTTMPKVAEHTIEKKFPEAKIKTKTTTLVEALAKLVCQLLLLPLIDQFGRKKFLLIGMLCSVGSSFMSTFAVGYLMYVISRGIQLFFSALLPTVSYIYSIESMASKKRTLITVLTESVKVLYTLYLLGLKRLVEVFAVGGSVWLWLSPLACIPTILPIGLLFFATESPRFALSVAANKEQAGKILAKLTPTAQLGLLSRIPPLKMPGLRGHQQQTAPQNQTRDERSAPQERAGDGAGPRPDIELMIEKKGPFKKVQMSYVNEWHIISNPLTYMIGIAWIFQTCSVWGLNTYMNAFPDFLGFNETITHVGTLAIQFVGQIILWIIMLLIGRVWAIRVFASACALCHLVLGFLLLGGVTHPGALSPFTFIAFVVGPPLWGPIIAYSNERFPTTLRSTALAILSASSSLCEIGTMWFREFQMQHKEKWIVPLVLAALNVCLIASSLLWKFDTATLRLTDQEDEPPKEDPETVEMKQKRRDKLRKFAAKLKLDKIKGIFKRKDRKEKDGEADGEADPEKGAKQSKLNLDPRSYMPFGKKSPEGSAEAQGDEADNVEAKNTKQSKLNLDPRSYMPFRKKSPENSTSAPEGSPEEQVPGTSTGEQASEEKADTQRESQSRFAKNAKNLVPNVHRGETSSKKTPTTDQSAEPETQQ
eukprot:Gregarina_sp_Poly_1__1126@NODE_1276_length_4519_cov_154_136119_g866_i0_p1_GENE_NODE_1276_length_4519_cov_154_136119_g866_i0NODE_1276_length_4519_cov_154_136119_g866_i0_p1_ORF_typecomplete_len709_score96_58Sugar_tr/PF00083_24/4_4e38MFS_1/PF07690_16/4_4e02MFS_1/PF07690_16/1_5e16MFS_1/PF07690_16/0_019MFS_2/PF13347_6/1_9e05MFS_2/PF13347_6/12MFS_1_like/PF12832_7/0_0014OATP/PF03137_20/0_13_NODE_1276_length_4519_cov_154_136119_g866_i0542180